MGNTSEPLVSFAVPSTPGVSLSFFSAAANPGSSLTAVVWPVSAGTAATGFGALVDELEEDFDEEASELPLLQAASDTDSAAAAAIPAAMRFVRVRVVNTTSAPVIGQVVSWWFGPVTADDWAGSGKRAVMRRTWLSPIRRWIG